MRPLANLRTLTDLKLGRTGLAEFAGLALFGVFMAAFNAFDTDRAPRLVGVAYWIIVMVGGGVIGALIEPLLLRIAALARRPVLRGAAQAMAMTPPIALYVWLMSAVMFGQGIDPARLIGLLPAVLSVNAAVVILAVVVRRALSGPPPPPRPAHAAPRTLAEKLPPRLARARLLAVTAEDHYLRVRTEVGDDLVLMRFADALAALAELDGVRTHRSWWVARDAVDTARWRKGRGELTLSNGVTVPVSAAYAAAIKKAGWT